MRSRVAYCTSCDTTFAKMHLMINHRRTDRCGGRFLPLPERIQLNKLRKEREEIDRIRRVLSSAK